jgi:hypothetical protein
MPDIDYLSEIIDEIENDNSIWEQLEEREEMRKMEMDVDLS